MRKLFGTDGVRGEANQFPMTPEIAMALGQAAAWFFRKKDSVKRIIIGKDTRRSSYMIENAMAAGICSMGCTAIYTGPIPTPAVAFLTKAMRADAGVMISASHNRYEDNGIKFFDRDGFKLTDEEEMLIEDFVFNKLKDFSRPTGMEIGNAFRIDDAQGRYIEFVKRALPKRFNLDGLKIVVDCANGAAYKVAPQSLWELGAEVIRIGVEPDGKNINSGCGALHPEKMAKKVVEVGADLGIALDGDADRVIICDEKGEILHGDKLIAMCAVELNDENFLDKRSVVGTIMTNMGVEKYLKDHGIDMIRTKVGDRYIIEAMKENGFKLGGEPSGHVIFSKHTTTGDGLIAALQVLTTMVKSEMPLSELVKSIPIYPQVTKNLKVTEKKPLESIPEIQNTLQSLEEKFNGQARSVIRYSGTEPLLRIMLEGKEEKIIQEELASLVKVFEKHLVQ